MEEMKKLTGEMIISFNLFLNVYLKYEDLPDFHQTKAQFLL